MYLVELTNIVIIGLPYLLKIRILCYSKATIKYKKGGKMSAQDKLIKAQHIIDMNDIIREGNPTLRAVAKEVELPLSDDDIILGEKMMQFLKYSQDRKSTRLNSSHANISYAVFC